MTNPYLRYTLSILLALALTACGESAAPSDDSGAGGTDSGLTDAAGIDGGGASDSGGSSDSGTPDTGSTARIDAGELTHPQCFYNDDCQPNEYCHRPNYMCEVVGTCRVRPGDGPFACASVLGTFCGCNGVTYADSDICDLPRDGTTVRVDGRCP